jgi:hypothetical protein
MKITTILLICAVSLTLSATLANADPYHRFWRGTKLSKLSAEDFQNGLNEIFIAKTIQMGGGKGLIAYEPALTLGTAPGLPDEIALVSYEDEATYNRLRATPAGQAYGALHWQYFDKTQSSSLVPAAYTGAVALEHAYDLYPSFTEWKAGNTRLLIQFRNDGEADATYLARVKADLDQALSNDAKDAIQGVVCLVTQKYWIEYVSSKTLTKQISMNPIVTDFSKYSKGKTLALPVDNQPVESAKLKPGRGVNVQF